MNLEAFQLSFSSKDLCKTYIFILNFLVELATKPSDSEIFFEERFFTSKFILLIDLSPFLCVIFFCQFINWCLREFVFVNLNLLAQSCL